MVLVLSFLFYGNLLRHVFATGGKVNTAGFGPADAGLALVFIMWFSWIAATGFTNESSPVKISDLTRGAIIFVVVVTIIASTLRLRGIRLREQFGLRRLGPIAVAGSAMGLLFAALPLVGCAGALMQNLLGSEAKPQDLVQFFLEASKNSDNRAVIVTVLLGAVVAPMAEEFIFRGFLYGVLKRYIGMAAAIVLNAALFAAIHLNVTSLPALFILAVCFTIAYETTGSILVSMSMHALFNLIMFFGLIQSARAMQ